MSGRTAQDQAYLPGEVYRTNWTPELTASVQAFGEAWKGKIKVLIAEPSIGLVEYQAHEACWTWRLVSRDTKPKVITSSLKSEWAAYVAYVREKFCEFAVTLALTTLFP